MEKSKTRLGSHNANFYGVIVRLDLATDRSTLWVDPVSEDSLSVTATDFMSVMVGRISAFALRQGVTGTSPNVGSCGELYLDHLRVGLSFADVAAVPEPRPLHYAAMGGLLLFLARILPRRRALRE